jgi:hypothetical protein
MLRSMLQECEHALPSDVSVKKQSSSLIHGVTSKVYKPLLERPTCSEYHLPQMQFNTVTIHKIILIFSISIFSSLSFYLSLYLSLFPLFLTLSLSV